MPSDMLQRHHVSVSGSGSDTMIFAHGFGSDQRVWDSIIPSFESSYRVVRFDLAGFGQPDPVPYDFERYGSLHGQAEDLLEICAALGARRVVYVGHSVSAMVGVLAANRQVEAFGKLIFLGATPRYLDDPPDYVGGFSRADVANLLDMMDRNFIGFARMFAAVAMQGDAHPRLSEGLVHTMCGGDPEVTRHIARVLFMSDHRKDVEQVRVPVLLVHCGSDPIAPIGVGQFLHAHIPDSTLAIIPGSGHCPHISHPKETVAHLRAFLQVEPS